MRPLALLLLMPVLAIAQSAAGSDWGTKTIELKYLDPEQLREVFSGRSFVMQANRDGKTLTVSGPAAFLQDVEQTGKRLDVAPSVAPDIEVTIYLLGSNMPGAAASDLPTDVRSLAKTIAPTPATSFGLTDVRTMRVANGQGADVRLGTTSSPDSGVAHISFQMAEASNGSPKSTITLSGLRCWLSEPSTAASASKDSDFAATINLTDGRPALVVQSGVRKAVAVIVRASITQ